MKDLTIRFPVLGACCLYILLGAAVIPYAGVQNDEALFGNPIYFLNPKEFCVTIFHQKFVLMAMSYVGTLKTLIYLPILAAFGGNVWSIRFPMVLTGALTIYVFYYLALRLSDRTTALIAIALLATDPIFLLTDTFDWGPVALQHVLLVTGCLFMTRFGQPNGFNSRRDLAIGSFFLGLALWNKAIVLWAFAGLLCATLTILRHEVRRAFRPVNVAVAAAAFLTGALPFVIYNIRHPNATLSSTAHLDTAQWGGKLSMARGTLNGSGLLGFLPASDLADNPKAPSSRRGRIALWIHDHFGEHDHNGLLVAFGLGILAVPLWWRSRAARFSLVFLATAWVAMALTRDAGGAVHHSVLLWPFPHLFLASVLSSLRWRWLISITTVVLVVMNLLVLNQYIYQFERDGAEGNFTDAINTLSEALPDPPSQGPAQSIYVMDWGMLSTLAIFHQGRLALRVGDDLFSTDTPTPSQRLTMDIMFSDRNALFVNHVAGREVTTGVTERLARAAANAGVRKELIRTISDSNGRPVFEIFRYRTSS